MYIHEAIREAQSASPHKPCITRKSWRRLAKRPGGGVKIQPTNSPDCCIIESDTDAKGRPRWNPTADDLLADDWVAVSL